MRARVTMFATIKGRYEDGKYWEFQARIRGFTTTNFCPLEGMRVSFLGGNTDVSRVVSSVNILGVDHGGGAHWEPDVTFESWMVDTPDKWKDVMFFLKMLNLSIVTVYWTSFRSRGSPESHCIIGDKGYGWLPEEVAEFLDIKNQLE